MWSDRSPSSRSKPARQTKAQVSASNDRGWNALMLAVAQSNVPSVRLLLATPWAAAQASATSRKGLTAHFIAEQTGNQEIIALLGQLPPGAQ